MRPADHLLLPDDPHASVRACLAAPLPPDSSAEARAAAAGFARCADQAQQVLDQLARLTTSDADWQGRAGDAFRTCVHAPVKAHLDQLAPRLSGLSAALTAFAAAQDVIRPWAQAAWQEAGDALAALERLDDLDFPTPPLAAGLPGVDPAGQQRAAARAAAQARCLAAAQAYRRQYDDYADAADACARQLHVVDESDQLHNPHGFHAALDVAARIGSDIATYSAVLGLVAVVLCPAVAPLLFAISAATSVADLAMDGTRKYAYGENVSLVDLATDALGTVPMVATAKAGAAGARAARAATAVADSSRAARVGARVGAFAGTMRTEVGTAYREMLRAEPATGVQALRTDLRAQLRVSSSRDLRADASSYGQDVAGLLTVPVVGDYDDRRYQPYRSSGQHWMTGLVSFEP